MGTRIFIWRLKDFIWGAALVQMNDKVQLGGGSGCGFTEVGGREMHSKCSWKNAAPGFQPPGYSWPELMMIYESYRTLFILRPESPSLKRSVTLFSLGTGGKINALRDKVV